MKLLEGIEGREGSKDILTREARQGRREACQ